MSLMPLVLFLVFLCVKGANIYWGHEVLRWIISLNKLVHILYYFYHCLIVFILNIYQFKSNLEDYYCHSLKEYIINACSCPLTNKQKCRFHVTYLFWSLCAVVRVFGGKNASFFHQTWTLFYLIYWNKTFKNKLTLLFCSETV